MKIFSYVFNNPKYLIYQSRCLKKFVTEPFEFICIDNSSDIKYTVEFRKICKDENIHYIRNEKPDHSLPGQSHYAAMQWSYKEIISKANELCVMMDHDTFAIKPLSFTEILGDAHMAGARQSRNHVEYLHPSLMILNPTIMPNKDTVSFKGSTIDEQLTDIGGELYFYFRDNPEVKIKHFGNGHIAKDNPLIADLVAKYGYPSPFELVADSFFHPRNGSNWEHIDAITFGKRESLIFELLDSKLRD